METHEQSTPLEHNHMTQDIRGDCPRCQADRPQYLIDSCGNLPLQAPDLMPYVPRLHRRRSLWIAVGAVGSAGIALAALLLTGGHPPVSAACQRAVAAQNTYVDDAIAAGYPNIPIYQGMVIISADIALLNNMTKAGCPGNTLVHTLPDN